MNRQQNAPPSYEGRPLVRPDDEVVDQGLGFDVGTLMNRRRMLRTLGFGVVTIGLAACGANAASSTSSASAATTSAASSVGTTTAAAASGEIPDEPAGAGWIRLPAHQPHILEPGTRVRIGERTMTFQSARAEL